MTTKPRLSSKILWNWSPTTTHPGRVSDVPYSPLAELPYEVSLVEKVLEDGSLTYCESTNLPPLVKTSIIKHVEDAQNKHGKTWRFRFQSKTMCAAVSIIGVGTSAGYRVDGIVGKFACRRCFRQQRACIVFDEPAKKFAVVPVPPETRHGSATPGSDAYYISACAPGMSDGPWQKECTRKRKRLE